MFWNKRASLRRRVLRGRLHHRAAGAVRTPGPQVPARAPATSKQPLLGEGTLAALARGRPTSSSMRPGFGMGPEGSGNRSLLQRTHRQRNKRPRRKRESGYSRRISQGGDELPPQNPEESGSGAGRKFHRWRAAVPPRVLKTMRSPRILLHSARPPEGRRGLCGNRHPVLRRHSRAALRSVGGLRSCGCPGPSVLSLGLPVHERRSEQQAFSLSALPWAVGPLGPLVQQGCLELAVLPELLGAFASKGSLALRREG